MHDINKDIKSFSSKMGKAALIPCVVVFIVVGFIFFSNDTLKNPVINVILQGLQIILWFYLFMIMLQFYRCTKLKEYMITFHPFWLSGVIAYPISFIIGNLILLVGSMLGTSLQILSAFSGLLWTIVFIWLIRLKDRRAKNLKSEMEINMGFWRRLSALRLIDIMLLKFPTSSK